MAWDTEDYQDAPSEDWNADNWNNNNLDSGSVVGDGSPQLNYPDNSTFNFGNWDTTYPNDGGYQGLNNLFQMNNGVSNFGSPVLNTQADYQFDNQQNSLPPLNDIRQSANISFSDSLTKMLSGFGNSFLGGLGGMSNKGMASGLGALVEGRQNKQNAQQAQNIIQQQQAAADPFASQRPFYQQQMQQAVTNPYSVPIVRDQIAQLQAAQARKDAAAGRRSNTAASNPALLAEAAKIAQNYMTSMAQPAGANFRPDTAGLRELLAANQQKTNGYLSPLMSALGYTTGTATNSNMMNNAQQQSTLGNLLKVLSMSASPQAQGT